MKLSFVTSFALVVAVSDAYPAARRSEATSDGNPNPTLDQTFMYQIGYIANTANGEFGNEKAFALKSKKLLDADLASLNEAYGTNLELVWGPTFKMTSTIDLSDATKLPQNNLLQLAAIASDVGGAKEAEKDTAINGHYIAYDNVTETYYMGLAATNEASSSSWFLENFWVDTYFDWPYDKTGAAIEHDAKVFAGTFVGLEYTTSTKPIKGMPGAGKTMAQFLKGNTKTLRIAGFSLAGNLAPVVALYAQDMNLSKNVTCNAYAGTTPGNVGLANYYASKPLAKYTVTTVNFLDLIPKAWVPAQIETIPTLYESQFPDVNPNCTAAFSGFLLSLLGNITDAAPINPQKNVEFNVGYNDGASTRPFGGDLVNVVLQPLMGFAWEGCKDDITTYLTEAGWQHNVAYPKYLQPLVSYPSSYRPEVENETAATTESASGSAATTAATKAPTETTTEAESSAGSVESSTGTETTSVDGTSTEVATSTDADASTADAASGTTESAETSTDAATDEATTTPVETTKA